MNDTAQRELDRQQVLDWLAEHPDALQGADELVQSLRFRTGDGQQVIGLEQYRQQQLQQEQRQTQQELARFRQLVMDNEQLLHRLHQWVLHMLDARDRAELVLQVLQGLKETFGAEVVALHLQRMPGPLEWPEGCVVQLLESGPVQKLATLQQPRLGRLPDSQLEALFGPLAGQVQSAVLLPMQAAGLLAIGSGNPLHYQSGMGTELLSFASQCLLRLLRIHG